MTLKSGDSYLRKNKRIRYYFMLDNYRIESLNTDVYFTLISVLTSPTSGTPCTMCLTSVNRNFQTVTSSWEQDSSYRLERQCHVYSYHLCLQCTSFMLTTSSPLKTHNSPSYTYRVYSQSWKLRDVILVFPLTYPRGARLEFWTRNMLL
jgi:hypothetical protein